MEREGTPRPLGTQDAGIDRPMQASCELPTPRAYVRAPGVCPQPRELVAHREIESRTSMEGRVPKTKRVVWESAHRGRWGWRRSLRGTSPNNPLRFRDYFAGLLFWVGE